LFLEKKQHDTQPEEQVDLDASPRRSTRISKPTTKAVATVAPIKKRTGHQTPRKGQNKQKRKSTKQVRTLSTSPDKATRTSLRRGDTSSARLWDKANAEGNEDGDEGARVIEAGDPTVRVCFIHLNIIR
jgi:hypothetical protein